MTSSLNEFEAYVFLMKQRPYFPDFWRMADDRWLQYVEHSVKMPAMFETLADLESAYTAFVWQDFDAMYSYLRFRAQIPTAFLR